jgi:hypothetical protein
MAQTMVALDRDEQPDAVLDPPWTAEERQAITNVFKNPDYSKRTSVQVLEALQPFIVARVEAARAAALKAGSWQPMETAPKDGSEILCAEYHDGKAGFEHAHWRFWTARWSKYVSREASFGPIGEPSMWQHLPPAPESE